MNKFYSSLVISNKKFPNVHQVIRPRYNKEFFKRLTKNIDSLDAHIKKRCPTTIELTKHQLDLIKKDSNRYVRLKDQLEQSNKEDNAYKHSNLLDELDSIQDRIMPSVVNIPNRYSANVPETETILDQLDTNFMKNQRLTKELNHTKLSYINRCYSKSVVGPNSHYYTGIGAKLQLGLNEYFFSQLEDHRFIPVSGPCLVKSSIIEACNCKEVKDYMTDPCRILINEPDPTSSHVVEASLESLVAFLTTLGHIVSDQPVRLMCSGSGYRKGSTWFDADENKISQYEKIHCLIWNSSIEQYSMKEYENLKDVIWSIYRKLDLPLRLVHCSLDGMVSNEYDAHKIEVWLPSQKTWLTTARISHYLDYITVRSGMKRGHLIDSMVYDGQVLGAAIVENRQTRLGRFVIPPVLNDHLPHLTQEESNYLDNTVEETPIIGQVSKTHHMTNFDQRRYLVKKTPLFSHSKRSRKNSNKRKVNLVGFFAICAFLSCLDWEEIFFRWLPTFLQRFMYDLVYRPVRRIWWSMVYVGVKSPADSTFDETNRSIYEKNMYQRLKQQHKEYDPTSAP